MRMRKNGTIYVLRNFSKIGLVKKFLQLHNDYEGNSGIDNIDKFIQNTQLSAHENVKGALEWIPYEKFRNIE
ncbi:hypothetical protein RclHR1_01920009 [Rhizophagus clarus]|uniref:Kinase-like domain-containing protein n=1 Tax=Rhizophagus clarus TaxID=94130 RepID=A0A2Z6QQR5_9GLOM|nr:hypothetical protein RclHR1_01920009 [Rhizophagus clarus]GES84042.1 kinase-like domain-containing protein [Rhizophagus clarus]